MSSTATLVIAVLLVLAIIALVATFALRVYRSQRLRATFGPEYDRTVAETGDQRRAEQLLTQRVQRRRELPIRELDPPTRERYADQWRTVQSRFVDDPRGVVGEADNLVTSLMRERGYPTEGYEQQVADVSVDHAQAAADYRQAHEVLANARGDVATDDLRQAMVHYREVFEGLLGQPATEAPVKPAPNGPGDKEPAPDEGALPGPKEANR